MSFTLCSSYAATIKAGAGVNTNASTSTALMTQYSDEAEGRVCLMTRKNWVTAYAGLSSAYKFILEETTSAIIASHLIEYDMSGYATTTEAVTMLNYLDTVITRNIEKLEKDANKGLIT